ncbi:hypothetical protein [Kibdelosporangium philippinense]|uniref:hypothetical protein n=1 Tax=Kibdelosporangium philippinense TaxID=211113 RepID=UPI00361A6991
MLHKGALGPVVQQGPARWSSKDTLGPPVQDRRRDRSQRRPHTPSEFGNEHRGQSVPR